MTLFTDSELDTLEQATRILASKSLVLKRKLLGERVGMVAQRIAQTCIDRALAYSRDWREVNSNLGEV